MSKQNVFSISMSRLCILNMISCSVWNGIDRRSFFEDAILLSDQRYRSQGHPLKMRNGKPYASSNPTDQADQLLRMTPDFLNDFALVASGPGGPDNVTATCLELSDDGQTHMLRVARNSGGHNDVLVGMKDIITTVGEGSSTDSTIFRSGNLE